MRRGKSAVEDTEFLWNENALVGSFILNSLLNHLGIQKREGFSTILCLDSTSLVRSFKHRNSLKFVSKFGREAIFLQRMLKCKRNETEKKEKASQNAFT